MSTFVYDQPRSARHPNNLVEQLAHTVDKVGDFIAARTVTVETIEEAPQETRQHLDALLALARDAHTSSDTEMQQWLDEGAKELLYSLQIKLGQSKKPETTQTETLHAVDLWDLHRTETTRKIAELAVTHFPGSMSETYTNAIPDAASTDVPIYKVIDDRAKAA